MARRGGKIQRNTFVRGLITEATPLTFPENASILDENFDLFRDGSRARRLGIDFEGSYTANEIITANQVQDAPIRTFEWYDAGTSRNKNFIVVQIGTVLNFFDVGESDVLSANKRAWTLDLSDYVLSGKTATDIEEGVTTADVIRGLLVVTNERAYPVYISYDSDSDILSAGIISVLTRDLLGIDDGFEVDYRVPCEEYGTWNGNWPSSTGYFNRGSILPHWYNLYNQGWSLSALWHCHLNVNTTSDLLTWGFGLPIDEWDGSSGWGSGVLQQAWPSNADIMHLGKTTYQGSVMTVDEIGDFAPFMLYKANIGNAPAPRGASVINVLDSVRSIQFLEEPIVSASVELANGEPLSKIRSEISSISYNTSTNIMTVVANGRTGRSSSTVVKPKNNTPIKIKGVGATANYTEGGVIYSRELDGSVVSFTDVEFIPTTVSYNGTTTTYTFKWNMSIGDDVNKTGESVSFDYTQAQLYYYGDTQHEIVQRDTEGASFTATASYASRAWYAGLNSGQFQNYIFFSQIIKDHTDLGKCYQEGDPTSEFNSDVLDNDGGYIVIPEAERIVKMVPMGRNLFVFAKNGIWKVSGGETNFTATSYAQDKISSVGVDSIESVVSVEDKILFWGIGGIYSIGIGEVSNDYEVVNISEETIQTEFLGIDSVARQYCTGNYDPTTKRVVWLTNESPSYTDSGGVENYYKYDTIYILETVLGSFFKYKIATDTTNTLPFVSDIIQLPTTTKINTLQNVYSNGVLVESNAVQVVSTKTLPRKTLVQTKLLVTSLNTGGTPFTTFAEFNNSDFLDWYEYDATGSNYLSHLITGQELGEDYSLKKQGKYLHMFFKRTEENFTVAGDDVSADNPSSCLISAMWDFATDKDSPTSSDQFQAYRIPRYYVAPDAAGAYTYGQDVIHTKNKIRGKGRALSLDIRSEQGKDMHIYGWAIPITRQERS